MAGIHADTDDDNFQSGSADQVDTSYAFHKWYLDNHDKLMDLTRVSEANSGIMHALEYAYEAGMEFSRTRDAELYRSNQWILNLATGRIEPKIVIGRIVEITSS